jgi:hypothetical protein
MANNEVSEEEPAMAADLSLSWTAASRSLHPALAGVYTAENILN